MFMSPESLRVGTRVDARSDLYSLGAMAYFMITGSMLFEGGSPAEVAAMQLRDQPVPPSERLGRPVPADLEALVLACLAKDPLDRPASATALAADLDRCVDADGWGDADAEGWWLEHGEEVSRLVEDGFDHRKVAVELATRPD